MRKREIALASAHPGDAENRDPQFIAALARGLSVLRAFRRGDPPLGNQELAARTGLAKATVSRITYTLSSLGYLNYAPDTAKYTLSVAALSLGFSALGHFAVSDVARRHMQSLADETGVSVALGARDGTTMVYVEHCRGDSPLHIGIEVGSHINLANSAMGRAYLAALDPAERESLVAQLRRKPNWDRSCEGIKEALDLYAERGFVLSLGEWKPEVNGVAAPLVLGSGELIFALNCGGPAVLLPKELLIDRVGPRLVSIAQQIRRDMALEPRLCCNVLNTVFVARRASDLSED